MKLAAWLMFAVIASGNALAQSYPAKPIRFIVGPGPDALARVIGQQITQAWGQPAKLSLQKIRESGGVSTVQARLLDQNDRQCLDARSGVRFALIGDGRLLDNLGTSTGARKLELYNGRAEISLERKGEVVVSVSSEGLKTAFLQL